MDEMEPVFKALADPHRRLLLDHLREHDGSTLLELQGLLPMTRFGVMKHLKVLEEAGLVSTKKSGREKFHYLNPVPIQQLYNRWVSKYAKPWAFALAGLKDALESEEPTVTETMSAVTATSHTFEVFIKTTPERLWQALTDGAITKLYFFGVSVESDWTPGSPIRHLGADGGVMLDGEILEIDPPRKLVTTFIERWDPTDPTADGRQPSKVTYEIEPKGGACKLTLTHEDLVAGSVQAERVSHGWAHILSGLKTYLETGEVLTIEG
jgi:uncharacterized protein YndB with AHSA1/START domain/DNA-binding transcriptional ArsR family regulator